jgi:hypothetical protein
MCFGKCSSRLRPHDAAYSSRAPSVAREQPGPCRPLQPRSEDRAQVAQANHDGRRAVGQKAPKSTVLTPAEEAIVVAFRQKTLLPLDDVLGCLRDTIPNSAAAPCIAVSNVMASPDCRSKRPRSSASGSRPTRSATSTSTAASSATRRVGHVPGH